MSCVPSGKRLTFLEVLIFLRINWRPWIRERLSSDFWHYHTASLELDNSPPLHNISDSLPKRAHLPALHTLHSLHFLWEENQEKYVPSVNPSVIKTKLWNSNCQDLESLCETSQTRKESRKLQVYPWQDWVGMACPLTLPLSPLHTCHTSLPPYSLE